jgi:predicted GNAT family N-acyltransferase
MPHPNSDQSAAVEHARLQSAVPSSPIKHPTYETHGGEVSSIGSSIRIVRDFEDMAKVFAVRGAAYLTDPEHIYSKHFDGNDFSATHLLGFIDGEPVATIRIRYFSDFTRIERLAVIPQKRKSRISFQIAKASFDFCRDKGYRVVRGVAREELLPFWSVLGWRVDAEKAPIYIYGLPHFEILRPLEASGSALNAAQDPLVLLRPEGRWGSAGFHETKNVTKPHVPIDVRSMDARGRLPGDIAASLRQERRALRRAPKSEQAGVATALSGGYDAGHRAEH